MSSFLWRFALCLWTGGPHAGERSPKPDDESHPPPHAASPGSTKRTPQHRPDPAGGQHGRQLCGEFKSFCFFKFLCLLKVWHCKSAQAINDDKRKT